MTPVVDNPGTKYISQRAIIQARNKPENEFWNKNYNN